MLTSLSGVWAMRVFPPRCAPPAGPPSWLTPGLYSLQPTGHIWGTVWFCVPWELKMVFTCLIGWTKQTKKNTLWHVKMTQNSNCSVHNNFIEAQPLRFAYILSMACAVMAELSSSDRCGLQSQQCFLGGPWQKNLGSTCLYEDALPGFLLACCPLSSSCPSATWQLGNSESSNEFWEAFLTPADTRPPGPIFLWFLPLPHPQGVFPSQHLLPLILVGFGG